MSPVTLIVPLRLVLGSMYETVLIPVTPPTTVFAFTKVTPVMVTHLVPAGRDPAGVATAGFATDALVAAGLATDALVAAGLPAVALAPGVEDGTKFTTGPETFAWFFGAMMHYKKKNLLEKHEGSSSATAFAHVHICQTQCDQAHDDAEDNQPHVFGTRAGLRHQRWHPRWSIRGICGV